MNQRRLAYMGGFLTGAAMRRDGSAEADVMSGCAEGLWPAGSREKFPEEWLAHDFGVLVGALQMECGSEFVEDADAEGVAAEVERIGAHLGIWEADADAD